MFSLVLLASLAASAVATYYQPDCNDCVGTKCFVKGPHANPKYNDINDKCSWFANSYQFYGPNGRAAVPANDAENQKAYHACGDSSAFGISDRNQEGVWENMKTNELVYDSNGEYTYTNWASGQPYDIGGQDIATFWHGYGGKWNDGKYDSNWNFCCEYDRQRCCPETGACFAQGPAVDPSHGSPNPGDNLTPACKAELGDEWEVAVPETEEENEKAFYACGHDSFLGIMDYETEGYWKDINKNVLISIHDNCQSGKFCNWLGHQPNNYGGQHIVHFLYNDMEWNDIGIDHHAKVCCQKRPGSQAPSEAPTFGQVVSAAPSPVPSPAPSPATSPAPTPVLESAPPTKEEKNLCVGGITNSDGSICCDELLCGGLCGGCGCSKEAGGPDLCCPNTIIFNDIYCMTPDQRGCIIHEPIIIHRDTTCPPLH
mmetsp:Transcript_12450/g.46048  ORF Transcript_12450/g.46048 Transcript_12450/m.46048 type:complete len:428 (-) Transcript_12450:397-1680(-)